MAMFSIEESFPSNRLFNQGFSYTYDDLIFLPHYIDFPTDPVTLSTNLTRNISLSLSIVSSSMDSVTESAMAVSMASLGGIGTVHYNNTPSEQVTLIKSMKSRRLPFVIDPLFKTLSDSINSVHEFTFSSYFIVTSSVASKSKPTGIVSKSLYESLFDRDKESPILSYMTKVPVHAPIELQF